MAEMRKRSNYIPVDFKILTQKQQKCNKSNDRKGIIANCSHLFRIAYSLKHYQTLSSSNDKFMQFISNKYKMCLDDYIHLICVHSDDLNQITKDLMVKYNVNPCNHIDKCQCTYRHYRDRCKKNDNYINDKYNFYIEIFDSIHFYLFHLEDVGFRVVLNKIKIKHQIEISKQIKTKQKKYEFTFSRLNHKTNTKFIIQHTDQRIVIDKDGNECTFSDELFTYLEDNIKSYSKWNKVNVNDKQNDILHDLVVFLDEEEYDTDSICFDIDILDNNAEKCNILHVINNNEYIQCIKQFAKH
eukprot:20359_1